MGVGLTIIVPLPVHENEAATETTGYISGSNLVPLQYGVASQGGSAGGVAPPPPPAFNGQEEAIREPIYPCGLARARFPMPPARQENLNSGHSQMELLKQVGNAILINLLVGDIFSCLYQLLPAFSLQYGKG